MGFKENVFVSDFFDRLGFFPLASQRWEGEHSNGGMEGKNINTFRGIVHMCQRKRSTGGGGRRRRVMAQGLVQVVGERVAPNISQAATAAVDTTVAPVPTERDPSLSNVQP